MKRPVILFDFDGTIADTFDLFFAIGNEMAEEFGYRQVGADEIETYRNKTVRELMRDLGISPLQVPAILRRGKQELQSRMNQIELFPGIHETLLELKGKGLRLGVVTTNTLQIVQHSLTKNGLSDALDFVSKGSGMLGKGRAIKQAIREFNIDAGNAIFVGDELRDLEASRSAGVTFVAVEWGYNSAQRLSALKPDHLIGRPDQLLPIAAGLQFD